jgi:phosphate transport system ATP-binding protein
MRIEAGRITALIGPSGTGKSTVLRALNRLHEVPPNRRVEGRVLLDGRDIYAPEVDVNAVRRAIGMVFQQPNPFPAMSVYQNAVAGLILSGRRVPKPVLDEAAEGALRRANLWDEVKDRLRDSGASLSRRAAAAAVHRALDRGRPRRAAA